MIVFIASPTLFDHEKKSNQSIINKVIKKFIRLFYYLPFWQIIVQWMNIEHEQVLKWQMYLSKCEKLWLEKLRIVEPVQALCTTRGRTLHVVYSMKQWSIRHNTCHTTRLYN